MSVQRQCKNCGMLEGIRYNFGSNREAEKEFHDKDWHNCETCTCENVEPLMCVCFSKAKI